MDQASGGWIAEGWSTHFCKNFFGQMIVSDTRAYLPGKYERNRIFDPCQVIFHFYGQGLLSKTIPVTRFCHKSYMLRHKKEAQKDRLSSYWKFQLRSTTMTKTWAEEVKLF